MDEIIESNDKDNNENTIHKSFTSLMKIIEKDDKNETKKDDKKSSDNFDKELFCCKECYDKFIKVAKKIKDNKIDLTKIDWGKYSNSQNIIVKLVTYYYNLGLQNGSK